MQIAMLGAGYVGLVSGACFAEFGVEVCLVDTDAAKVAGLRGGRIPIYEPGLDRLVEENAREGRLRFTTDLAEAMAGADAVFLAVGTPSRRGDGHADLTYVFTAAEQAARAAAGPLVLVTKSTVPPQQQADCRRWTPALAGPGRSEAFAFGEAPLPCV